MTIQLSDELAQRLEPIKDQVPHLLELGLRELDASPASGFSGLAEVLETLAGLPTPAEVLALRPSASLQQRIEALLEGSRDGQLSPIEQAEWERYQYLEHLVRLAKAKAHQRS